MTADAETQEIANVEGTRHAVELAGAIEAGCFHQVSSIAAAGLYRGDWREDMFDEAEKLDTHPYFRTKHESERVVREESHPALARLPAGDRRRRLAHRRDRQGRRPLLHVQAAAAGCGACCPPGCRRSASRAARSTSSRSTSSPTRSTTSPTSPTSTARPSASPTRTRRRPGELLNIFAKEADAPQAALRARVRRHRAGDQPAPHRAEALPAGEAGREAGAERGRDPGRGPQLRQLPDPLRLDQHPGGARRARASRCRRWRPTPTGSGTTGSATSTRACSRTARSPARCGARSC